ncbi:phosphotransferase enzyme family protein [Ulvibacterium marinum]|uniref:Aminoglycoside phosphotransferase family protein n=1 Tax=Ulvibacterium marinum TaxID=2419782 RepID=A0A3B0C9D5_9FLAO|nr:aminoglycoside phosphotransferase family protein [Ulvibacterium marinum]RKN79336.1 aminoglycoside phosphotransferase family protein [Ulvibacterium marinum]
MSRYSHNELNFLLENFSIAKKEYSLSPLTDGYINDTFLVKEGIAPVYILQRINHDVFPNVSGIMNNIEKAFSFLKSDDYHNISLVQTVTGQSYYSHKKEGATYWRLMTYMDNSLAHNTTENPKIAFGAGKIIGEFHRLLSPAKPESFVEIIPGFHDLNLRKKQFNESLSMRASDRQNTAKNAIAFAKNTLETLKELDHLELPLRICHNDTKLNNILFSKKTDQPLCLIDLDTLMSGFFHFDFGDAIRTIVNTAPEDEQDHDNIVFRRDLFDSFIDGLAMNGAFLTQAEIDVLPMGAVLMPFLHGIRALTDYLNGDVYYKVAYENQNLDRCLSLFDFTQKALEELDFMKDSIANRLSTVTL